MHMARTLINFHSIPSSSLRSSSSHHLHHPLASSIHRHNTRNNPASSKCQRSFHNRAVPTSQLNELIRRETSIPGLTSVRRRLIGGARWTLPLASSKQRRQYPGHEPLYAVGNYYLPIRLVTICISATFSP